MNKLNLCAPTNVNANAISKQWALLGIIAMASQEFLHLAHMTHSFWNYAFKMTRKSGDSSENILPFD